MVRSLDGLVVRVVSMVAVLSLFAAFAGSGASASVNPMNPATAWQDKVEAHVLEEAAGGQAEFLVYLSEQADLREADARETKLEKGRFVSETLKAVASRTQAPILADLARRGVEHRAYWVANMIWVRGDASAVQALAQRVEVAHLYADTAFPVDEPAQSSASRSDQSPAGVEWNITQVGAPQVWAAGYTGQGVVVGGQDTGYDWNHPALKGHYRGWNGASANHNYNWHDAIHENDSHTAPGNPCGFDSTQPCDDFDHGTHTMGTMVGDDGAANQIGMAPGAKWIGCRNMEQGWGKPSTYSECYEWFIAPYPVGATPAEGDPSKAPDVINNSWGCPPEEGCTSADILRAVVESVRAAGIVTVHSAGNSGPSCSTVSDPAAIYAASFSVGATDYLDNIAGFSSRGPVTADGSNRLKPDISAPGVDIRSSVPGGGYEGGWSGTSMAGPHVAGLVALLLSIRPDRAGQVDWIETVIEQNAVPRTTSQDCGGVPGSQVPNNTYGWGRIDAAKVLQSLPAAFDLAKTAPASVRSGELITYTLTITNPSVTGPTNNVVLSDTVPAGTAFVRATAPFTMQGDTVIWTFASLAAGGSLHVEFAVQAPETPGAVVNQDYGVRSDEIPFVQGEPVRTRVRPLIEFLMYFPVVLR